MRFFVFALITALTAASPWAVKNAVAQDLPLEREEQSEPIVPDEDAIAPKTDDVPLASDAKKAEAAERLDGLFANLKKTRNERAASRIANNIWQEWFRSDSATIDLFMSWSNEAMKRQDFHIALDYLDQVVTLAPEFSEGWNRRATLHFTMSNYKKSMADIQKVLELEPRHFGALSGMATILERSGNKEAALKAWQRALTVYPAMKSGQAALIRLSDELGGDPT